jgi:Dyp-type peroxidase family
MLRNLQGNILKGHGRDHSVHVFLEFQGSVAQVRTQFGAIASRLVTSALQQRDEADQFKAFGIPGGLFGNILLTAKGYGKLGLDAATIAAAFPEQPGSFGERSNFKEGMQAHGDELNDPAPATWEPGYRAGTIDAMILLADDDEGFLLRQARQILNEVSDIARILTVERGNALRNEEGEGIEHFGYADGRSQPIYYATDLADEGAIDKWDPSEPLKSVLVPDQTVSVPDSFGSYMVFRKLEQDVRHFKLRERDLADALGLVGTDRERAGAMAVGRFEDGTPLALSQADGFIPVKENNFTYAVDPDGLKCPFHAHIRKANPRGDIVRKLGAPDESVERIRRITRRGITYGTRGKHPHDEQTLDDLPTNGVGLLFMCFQASIANQFAFIQRSWVDNEGFLLPDTGVDPVIGQAPRTSGGATVAIPQQWHPQWGQDGPPVPFSFGQFVTLKGGEFFFAPSIPFLQSLSKS